MRTSIYVFCAFALFAATALAANTSVFVDSNDSNDSNKPIETIDAICINEVRITINTLVEESRVLKLSTHTSV
jgi:azurin